MIDRRFQEYFRVISFYHRANVERRPEILSGFVNNARLRHPDLLTRVLLGNFQQKETYRNAPAKPA